MNKPPRPPPPRRPFLPPIIPGICFIIFFVCSNCFTSLLTSDTSTPAPLAIRALRLGLEALDFVFPQVSWNNDSPLAMPFSASSVSISGILPHRYPWSISRMLETAHLLHLTHRIKVHLEIKLIFAHLLLKLLACSSSMFSCAFSIRKAHRPCQDS